MCVCVCERGVGERMHVAGVNVRGLKISEVCFADGNRENWGEAEVT